MLKASSANITLTPTISISAGDYSGNSLEGTMTSIEKPGNAYVLDKNTEGIGFYKLSATGTIDANQAYLIYDGSAGACEFFSLDGTSDIEVSTGDVNGDGKVSEADVVAMMSYIIGENPENFNVSAADMNGDGNVTVADVVAVIDIISGN